MPKEIERKFLVNLNEIPLPDNGELIKQGYFPIASNVKTVVRIRVKGSNAFLTIKGENKGAVRSEYEYAIPINEAEEMLEEMCQKPFIDKTRYEISAGKHIWEIDIFHGDNKGLVIAEIELSEESDKFNIPGWVGEEVTNDPRYYNSNLLLNPYRKWSTT
ncbi:CYTH domain-containing protein [uncultured Muriicola sp.]|uniref:CYTH domain-containing protein n=1 Tax=uncultured Muriicola sp. TaxID=1583102 RepID=UPI00260A7648|nr:CYTH domain-containing protein [uncultured Muriicola sp.]